jgi:hypothetical protein
MQGADHISHLEFVEAAQSTYSYNTWDAECADFLNSTGKTGSQAQVPVCKPQAGQAKGDW